MSVASPSSSLPSFITHHGHQEEINGATVLEEHEKPALGSSETWVPSSPKLAYILIPNPLSTHTTTFISTTSSASSQHWPTYTLISAASRVSCLPGPHNDQHNPVHRINPQLTEWAKRPYSRTPQPKMSFLHYIFIVSQSTYRWNSIIYSILVLSKNFWYGKNCIIFHRALH